MDPLGVLGALFLYAAALGLFVVEIFIPSWGAIGVVACLCIVYALWSLFAGGYESLGIFLIGFTLVYMVVSFSWGVRRISHKATLAEGQSTGEDVKAAASLDGEVGEAVSDLRPSGIAQIAGRRFDVIAHGEFLESGTPVRVVETSGNRIVVRRA